MQALQTHQLKLSNKLRPPFRWIGVCLIAALISACGGSSESTDTPAPPTGPAPGMAGPVASAFKLFPARLGLSAGDQGKLLAQSSAALTWSSSDTAIATVDGEGLVTAVASGSAVITATAGTTAASSTVKVHAVTAAKGSMLIATALAQNKISAEQALMYRVFARFGDDRLPAEFDSAPAAAPDHSLMREISGKFAGLSPATQEVLLPFFLPPIYAQSWHAQRLGLAPPARPQGSSGLAKKQQTVNCEVAASPSGWLRRSTAHFNIYYLDLERFGIDSEKNNSEAVAAVVEEVYLSLTQLLQRFPLSDLGESCNGGDGAVDIYLQPGAVNGDIGVVTTYPRSCENVPSYISLNTLSPIFYAGAALRPADETVRRAVKGVVAHEFAHVLQFAMDRSAACSDYEWLDEATAEWAMDHVDPTFDKLEDGFKKLTPVRTRTGAHLLRYLAKDHMRSMEKPGADEGPGEHGYAEYLFIQYLARKYTPDTIKLIFDDTTGRASVEAVESALAGRGGMKAVWPEFALTLWNGRDDGVLDYWSTEDRYDYGLANIFEPASGDSFAQAQDLLKTTKLDQKSLPRASFKLLKSTLPFSGDNYEIEPRSIIYEHLKFTDPTVHSVYFSNPIAAFPNREFIKVQAKKKIGGQWKETEDWTSEPYKQFCLDKKDERIEELLIIISNSEVNRGAEMPFMIPKFFPMLTSTSNVGCWKWQGSSSTVASASSPVPVESTGRGNVTFEVAALLPGRIRFETSAGIVNGNGTGTLGACTLTSVGAERVARKGPLPDGTIDVNLDLDIGFSELPGAEPPDRKLITLFGLANLSTTNTLVCPTGTTTSTFGSYWDWLHTDDPGVYSVSADGQTIEGRFTAVVPGGATITSVWKFTALRE